MDEQIDEWESVKKAFLFIGGGIAISGVIYGLLKYYRIEGKEMADSNAASYEENEEEPLEKKILILGLDGAGKSSIISQLNKSDDEVIPVKPTEGFNVVCVQTGPYSLNIWEIGGASKMRQYWNHFMEGTDVLVFVVNSGGDSCHMSTAGEELRRVAMHAEMAQVPVVVVANKQDLADDVNKDNILAKMKCDDSAISNNREIFVIESQVPPRGPARGIDRLQDVLTKLKCS